MTRALFNQAIELINDDLITESATANTVRKKFSWPKIAAVAACLAVVVCLVPAIMNFLGYHAEDPNWYKTHTYAYSVDEAVKKFGDDLLLDRLVLKDNYPAPYVEFILAHAEGGANDRQTWGDITARVNYGGERFSMKEDHLDLRIFFNEDDPSLDGSDEYQGYRSAFEDGSETTEINGITVRYREYSNNNFAYAFVAEFKYDGKVYFLSTYSKENSALSWDTLTQMLAP
jgi:hypothetical protein